MSATKLARRLGGPLLAAGLTACAGHGGRGLEVGRSDIDAVTRAMGTPALQWTTNDGRRQLAYPRGPQGTHTYMAHTVRSTMSLPKLSCGSLDGGACWCGR